MYVTTFVLSFAISAGAYDSVKEFCANINNEAKEMNMTMVHTKVIEKMARALTAEKDCPFIKDNHTKPGWALIDARDKAARKSTGSFPGTVKITADHHDAKKHKFQEKILVKKLGKHFKKQKRETASIDDLKDKKLIIFCNGPTCYRSSWAACSLHEMGFKKENLHVVLDGYDGLKSCLK